MTKRLWAVIEYVHELSGEWVGKVHASYPFRRDAHARYVEILKARPDLGPTMLRIRKITQTVEDYPVTTAIHEAETVAGVRDILAEASITYHDASPATRRKWSKAALARELVLNRVRPQTTLVTLEESVLRPGGPVLVDPQGRPVRK